MRKEKILKIAKRIAIPIVVISISLVSIFISMSKIKGISAYIQTRRAEHLSLNTKLNELRELRNESAKISEEDYARIANILPGEEDVTNIEAILAEIAKSNSVVQTISFASTFNKKPLGVDPSAKIATVDYNLSISGIFFQRDIQPVFWRAVHFIFAANADK